MLVRKTGSQQSVAEASQSNDEKLCTKLQEDVLQITSSGGLTSFQGSEEFPKGVMTELRSEE